MMCFVFKSISGLFILVLFFSLYSSFSGWWLSVAWLLHWSSLCSGDCVQWIRVATCWERRMNLCLFFKRKCEPFLQLKLGLILLWWVLWPPFFVFCKHLSNCFYLQEYIHGKEHVSNMERKKCDTLWKHLFSCFGSSLWVLECFNHSVKTMPCNLAVQRPFTQPTHYSNAGIHSAGLDHQRSTWFLKNWVYEVEWFH